MRRVWALALVVGAWAPAGRAQDEEPLATGLVERAGEHLTQLDVSFIPKKKGEAELPVLGPEDFDLVINTRRIPIVFADRICRAMPTRPVESTPAPGASAAAASPAPVRPSTFVFYLEHKLLTMSGQSTAFEMAEHLVRRLIGSGNRGMVVSSGARIVQSPLTDDPELLLATLRDARKDVSQWGESQYAEREQARYEEIFDQPTDLLIDHMAHAFQFEEMLITMNRLRRLSAFVGGLGSIDPPKAVFYFADMVRKDPGAHYLAVVARPSPALASKLHQGGASLRGEGALDHTFAFDDLLNEANAQGVRLYTIEAQGMKPPGASVLPPLGMASTFAGRGPTVAQRRLTDAEDTMTALGAETGGDMFYGGTDASTLNRIERSIERDLSCFYLLNFRVLGLPQDSPLRVVLRLADTGRAQDAAERFTVRTRGQLVVQSAGRRERSRILAAHVSAGGKEGEPGRGVVIPLGFVGGRYQAMAQFVVRGADWPEGVASRCLWDVGMTYVAGTEVRDRVSAQVGASDPSVPVVLEKLWSFRPGASEIVAVGHEHEVGQLATARIELDWPDPDKSAASLSPIEIVQETDGVFLRKAEGGDADETRLQGSLGIGEGLVRVDQPAYLVVLLCRGLHVKGDLWARRRLSGSSAADFGVLEWKFDGERCIQLRDLVKAGQLDSGRFEYAIEVYDGPDLAGTPLAERRRSFAAVLPEEPSAAP